MGRQRPRELHCQTALDVPEVVGRAALVGFLLDVTEPAELVRILAEVLLDARPFELLPLALGPKLLGHVGQGRLGRAEGRLGRLERLLGLVPGVA